MIIIGAVALVLLIGGSILYSNTHKKEKVQVQVVDSVPIEKIRPKKTTEDTKNKDTETENKDSESKEESINTGGTENKDEDASSDSKDSEEESSSIIKSDFVLATETDNSRTYMGITGGGSDKAQYFYNFDQFDKFLTLIDETVPEHKEVVRQGNVFTAYYQDSTYVSYNIDADKMIVVKNVRSDEEGKANGTK